MPFINFQTNVKVNDADKMQKELGELIRIIPGKTPQRTMIQIDDEKKLYFAGNAQPCAMVETQVNKGTDQSTTKEYCHAVIEMAAKELGIEENRIYVNVTEMDNWFSK